MFIFSRTRTLPSEVWEILVALDSVPDAEKRFGPALRFRPGNDASDIRYHDVGRLVLIGSENDKSEILLAYKELIPAEQRVLDQEIERLVGHSVWDGGEEPVAGHFVHATLHG